MNMRKKLITTSVLLVYITEGAGTSCLFTAQDSALRPMATEKSKIDMERFSPTKSPNPYHPDNILATFKKGNLPWEKIPKEYLKADIRILVKELARLRNNKPLAELNTGDFKKQVFVMDSGKKKSLHGLLIFIMRKYDLSTGSEALLKIKKILKIKKYIDPRYHPDNILVTFKKGKLRWEKIPKEYLKADIRILVKELARLRKKEPAELNTKGFYKQVFVMDSGRKKSLHGLLIFIMRKYDLSTGSEALLKIKKIFKIKKYIDPRYHPDNILVTFKREKLYWSKIPKEYLKANIEVLVNELARLLNNKPLAELNTTDFYKQVFVMDSGKKKSLGSLLIFIMRKYPPSTPKEALLKIKKMLRIKLDLWESNNWKEIKKILMPNIPWGIRSSINTEKALFIYLYAHKLTPEEEESLAGLIKAGRGNKKALSALIYSHHRYIEDYVNSISKEYNLNPAALMEYVIRRLNKATLSFDPQQSRFATFTIEVIQSAGYDFMRRLSGKRRKTGAKTVPYPDYGEKTSFEETIADKTRAEPYSVTSEYESIMTEVLSTLGFSKRDISIYIAVKIKGETQEAVAQKLNHSPSLISLIIKSIKAKLAPYESMIEKVIKGEVTLESVLNCIRTKSAKASEQRPAYEIRLSQAISTQA